MRGREAGDCPLVYSAFAANLTGILMMNTGEAENILSAPLRKVT